MNRRIAIQGEIVGPKINCNRLGLDTIEFEVFNIYDCAKQQYLDWDAVLLITTTLGLRTVPTLYCGPLLAEMACSKYWIDYAGKQMYTDTRKAEGVVIKTNDCSGPRFSCKAVSNHYLMSEQDRSNKPKQRNKESKKSKKERKKQAVPVPPESLLLKEPETESEVEPVGGYDPTVVSEGPCNE